MMHRIIAALAFLILTGCASRSHVYLRDTGTYRYCFRLYSGDVSCGAPITLAVAQGAVASSGFGWVEQNRDGAEPFVRRAKGQ